jgi:hypothetical protein
MAFAILIEIAVPLNPLTWRNATQDSEIAADRAVPASAAISASNGATTSDLAH